MQLTRDYYKVMLTPESNTKANRDNTRWIHKQYKTKDFKRKCYAEKCLEKIRKLAPNYSWMVVEYCYMSF